eukprot:1853206-Prymnesium_polylepis.1
MEEKRFGDHLSSPRSRHRRLGCWSRMPRHTDRLVPLAGVVRAEDVAPVGRRDAGVPGAGEARGGSCRAVVTLVVAARGPATVVIVVVIIT